MPMIDVYLPPSLLPADATNALGPAIAEAVLAAEGRPLAEPYASNTVVSFHATPDVWTGAGPAGDAVRVTVTTPPGALDRDGQRAAVADITRLVTDATGDPAVAGRTWVVLQEAAEGGWGVAGHALGREEFAALAAAAANV